MTRDPKTAPTNTRLNNLLKRLTRNPFIVRPLLRLDGVLRTLREEERRASLKQKAVFDSTITFGPDADINNSQATPSAIALGSHASIHGQLLVFRHGGQIRLGPYVYVGPGARIWSAVSVSIGSHVLISHGVNIHDTNSHPIDCNLRRQHTEFILNHGVLPTSSYETAEAPVHIDDDVWVGFNAVILKGVTVGRGAIIAAGSVVTQDVEPFTIVAGNPATPKKKIAELSL